MSVEIPRGVGVPAARGPRWLALPLVAFLAIVVIAGLSLRWGDPSNLPSALIGKPAPALSFAALEGLSEDGRPVPGFSSADLDKGQVSVVNFWASWCTECAAEQPLLAAFKEKTGVALYGVNYKDDPSAARRFLGRYGNPFTAAGRDPEGRGAIEWGVYGMPETFVVDGRGTIVYKHVGALTPEAIDRALLPAVEAARQTNERQP